MVLRIVPALLTVVLAFSFGACKPKKKDLSAEREAKFRTEQKARALKTYQELLKKYPDSQYAAQAKERVAALQPPATPAKK